MNLDVEAVRGTPPDGSNPTTSRISSNSSRFGLRGSEALGGGLSAFFQAEYAVGPDDGSANQPLRDSFVGLQGDWGSLQLGYFLAPYDDVSPLFGSVPTYLTSILSTSTLWSQGAQSKQNGGFDTRLPTPSARTPRSTMALPAACSRRWARARTPTCHRPRSSLAGFYVNGPLEVGLGYERNVEIRGPSLTDQALSLAGTWNFGTLRIGGVYERLRYETLSGDLTRNFWGVSATAALGPSAPLRFRRPRRRRRRAARRTAPAYVNRYPVAVGANPSGFVLGTAHSF
ncbi:MAG: porin [Betaproteobacteria bacterium]|nr:porin [Betaproteobacteria bacterium]